MPGRTLLVGLAVLLALSLGSCGASVTVIHIQGSSATITKAMLEHWMGVTIASEFRDKLGHEAPAGLVSEPADYPRCLKVAKKLVPRTSSGELKLSDAQISAKCRQLHEAVKVQALKFLLLVQWTELEGKEYSLHVSDGELHQELLRVAKELYDPQGGQRRYLKERHMSVADARYQIRRLILYTRLKPKFRARVASAGGGEKTFARLALAHYNSLVSKTICKPGYVVLGCKGYRESTGISPSPTLILVRLVDGLG
jgi:hypothetical protein